MALSFFYVYRPSKQKPQQIEEPFVTSTPRENIPSFEELYAIMKRRSTSTQALEKAAEQTLKYYGTIKPKHGIAPSKEFKNYGEMMFLVARHPNTTKEIILKFNTGLMAKNPAYKREIDEMLNRGLTARG